MQIIAHRGAHSETVRENTLLAFQRTLTLGFEMLELDARLTKDDKLIVSHDAEVFYEAKKIKFRDYLWDDLVADQICTPDGVGSNKHKIPPLKLALEIFLPQIRINVELKDKGSGRVLVDLLKDIEVGYRQFQYADLLKKLLISSFEESEIMAVKESGLPIETALLFKKFQFPLFSVDRKKIDSLSRAGVEGVHLPLRKVNRDTIEYLKFQKGFTVRVYTVNDLKSIFHCLHLGADAIFTDKPEEIRRGLTAKFNSQAVSI